MRIGIQCTKGYDLADFTDAFARFLQIVSAMECLREYGFAK